MKKQFTVFALVLALLLTTTTIFVSAETIEPMASDTQIEPMALPSQTVTGIPGVPLANSMSRPVSIQINQGYLFGEQMTDSKGVIHYHEGVDFSCAPKTTVKAAYAGTVVYTNIVSKDNKSDEGYGTCVVVEHSTTSGYVYTLYAHLLSFSVSKNSTISNGTTLGLSGDSGNTIGAHLHFGVCVSSSKLDFTLPYTTIESYFTGATRKNPERFFNYSSNGTTCAKIVGQVTYSGGTYPRSASDIVYFTGAPKLSGITGYGTSQTYHYNRTTGGENFVIGDINPSSGSVTLTMRLNGYSGTVIRTFTVRVFAGQTTYLKIDRNAMTDGFENNDTMSAAASKYVFTSNATIHGLISSSSDVDYYAVTIPAGKTVSFYLNYMSVDLNMALYDSAGTKLKTSANSNITPETISYSASSQTRVYLKIYGYNGSSNPYVYHMLRIGFGNGSIMSLPNPDEIE